MILAASSAKASPQLYCVDRYGRALWSSVPALHEMTPQLEAWGVAVRGPNTDATFRNAMRNDDRFEGMGRGRYRLREGADQV